MYLKRLTYFLTIAFTLVVCAMIIKQVSGQWAAIASFPWAIHPGVLAISGGVLVVMMVGTAAAWVLLARCMGIPLEMAKGLRIFFLSSLGKYLPGKVWTLVSVAAIGKQEGFGGARLASSMLYFAVLNVQTGLLLTLAGFALKGIDPALGISPSAMVWLIVCGVGLFFFPAFFSRMLRVACRIFHRQTPDIVLRFQQTLGLFLVVIALWGVELIGYWLLVRSYYPLGFAALPDLMLAWSLSVSVGFLAVFMPAGLGARDGMLLLMLQGFMPPEVASVSTLVFRAWGTAMELGICMVFLAVFLLTVRHKTALA